MSWRAAAWGKTVKTGSPSKKAVLMILAEHTDQWGWAWAGAKLIAAETELKSERHVRRLLHALAAAGAIEIHGGRGAGGQRINLYRLCFQPSPKDPMPPDHPCLSGRYSRVEIAPPEPEPPDKMTAGDTPEPPDMEGRTTGHGGSNHRAPESGEPIGTGSEPKVSPPCGPPGDDGFANAEVSEAVVAWNRLAAECGLAAVQRMNGARRRRLRARLAECGGMPGWDAALAKIRGSPHLRGRNRDGYRATFDFLTREQNFIQVMEGNYDPGGTDPGGGGNPTRSGSWSGSGGGAESPVQSALAGIAAAVDRRRAR